MTINWDQQLLALLGGIVALLVIASAVALVLERRVQTPDGRQVVANLSARIRAWWVMTAVLVVALASGGQVVLPQEETA